MSEMDDDIEFEQLLASKEHKEVVSLLKQLLEATKSSEVKVNVPDISGVLANNNQMIENFLAKLKEIKPAKTEINLDKFVNAILEGQQQLNEQLKVNNANVEKLLANQKNKGYHLKDIQRGQYTQTINELKIIPIK